MKREAYEKRKQLISMGIWSLAVLCVVCVGAVTLFSSPAKRTQNGSDNDKLQLGDVSETDGESTAPESQIADTEEVGWFKPANPIDTDIPGLEDVTEEEEASTDADASVKEEDDLLASADPTESFTCIMPINGTVTKSFTDDVAVYSLTMNDYRVHSGIDIAAPIGTNVLACAAGVVERVWEDPFMGYCITIGHGGGICSTYANLSAELPRGMEAGATVLCGEVIAGVGDSMIIEMADSEHLHFSVSVNGVPVDPMDYMENSDASAS